MGIREVLQTEIWSKETSRRIIRKTLVVMKFSGIGFGSLVVVMGLWLLVWTHWLTAKEHSAGKIALAQVDALQGFENASDTDFNAQAKRAQEKVDAASGVVLTAKDGRISFLLSHYLDEVQWVRKKKRMYAVLASRGYKRSERSKELDTELDHLERDEIKMVRQTLQETLEK